jgi:hypothetical protein
VPKEPTDLFKILTRKSIRRTATMKIELSFSDTEMGNADLGWMKRKVRKNAENASESEDHRYRMFLRKKGIFARVRDGYAYVQWDPLVCHSVVMPDGRTVQFFLNMESRLIVVDVFDADERGGVEYARFNFPKSIVPNQKQESLH